MADPLTKMQNQAVASISNWYKRMSEQAYILAGYAGTGKSFLVNFIIENLKINIYEVAFATYTGIAALVITRKANGRYVCKTLHSFRYSPEVQADGSVVFTKRDPESFRGIKLIVVDEASMPTKEIIDDLMDLGIPVLFVGDHGQLKPVGEQSWVYDRLKNSPDFALTEIHRQAANNPIISLSKIIREGKPISFGRFGKVAVIEKQTLNQYNKSLVNADQVICGLNATRHSLNQKIRYLRGIKSDMPVNGDKIICVQNNWQKVCGDYPLVNGMTGFMSNLRDDDFNDAFCNFDFTPNFMDKSVGVKAFKAQILGKKVDYKLLRGKNSEDNADQFNYGYAITGHKSQGSQWSKVLVINETFKGCEANEHGFNEEWAYTVTTRAENALIFAMNKPKQQFGFRAA